MFVRLAERITIMKAAIGCLATLCILLLIAVGVLVWLLIKARKTIQASKDPDEEPEAEEPPIKPAGPRPSDSDFMIPEVRSTGSPGMVTSHGSNSAYTPLKSGSSNGGTSQTYQAS